MTEFKNISELEILKLADAALLEKWAKERERIEENPDKEMPIAKHHEAKYWNMMMELEARIHKMENEQR